MNKDNNNEPLFAIIYDYNSGLTFVGHGARISRANTHAWSSKICEKENNIKPTKKDLQSYYQPIMHSLDPFK